MSEPIQNENVESNVADAADIAAATAATEEFTNTIGDAISTSTEEETIEAAPAVLDGPIWTVGRRKRPIDRIRVVSGSGEIN